MKILTISAVFLVLATGCNPDRINTKGVKEEIEKHKIKKITQGEIMGKADESGSLVTSQIQKDINARLDSTLKSGNIEKALAVCVTANNQLIKDLELQYSARIYRGGFEGKLRNPLAAPDTLQKMVLEGYSYSVEKGLPVGNDVQIRNLDILFNAPIILNSKTCLKCHGKVGEDIYEKDYKSILAKYPQDKSVGFKLNQPIGVWTVIFDKAALIRSIK